MGGDSKRSELNEGGDPKRTESEYQPLQPLKSLLLKQLYLGTTAAMDRVLRGRQGAPSTTAEQED